MVFVWVVPAFFPTLFYAFLAFHYAIISLVPILGIWTLEVSIAAAVSWRNEKNKIRNRNS